MGDDGKVSAGQGTSRPLVLDSYARLSRMPETGELEKIETQWVDNLRVIDRVGAVLGVQEQDGLSAWKRGVRRKGWELLLERVKSGVSDGVVVWHTDRLFRQPRDLETLIEMANSGYRVYSAHGSRDLSNADDRFILRIEVAQAAKSSDDTSRRIKRRFAAKREQGQAFMGGPRWFGWPGGDAAWKPGRRQSNADRPQVSAELVARERKAIRDATKALLDGVAGAQIVKEWNEAGLRTSRGLEWIWITFREMMMRPTNAGLVEHHGVLVASMDGDPIVDPADFERLRSMFAARRRGRVAGRDYLGTGILLCGWCGAKLTSHPDGRKTYKDGTKRASYFCAKEKRGCGKVHADVRSVDRELTALVIARLSDRTHAAAIAAAQAKVAQRLADVLAEIAQCEEIQEDLAVRMGSREITKTAFDKANAPLVRDLAALKVEREELEPAARGEPKTVQTPEEVEREWTEGSNAARRVLLMSALQPGVLFVDRFHHNGKRVFDPQRLRPGTVGEHRNTTT
jgi:DNA invertase Pin-like site-specific DNA recombinase